MGECGFELGERWTDFADAALDFRLGGDREVIFGKVDAGFEQGDQLQQGVLGWQDAMAEGSSHLAGRETGLGEGLGLDQVADGFGLGEVDAS